MFGGLGEYLLTGLGPDERLGALVERDQYARLRPWIGQEAKGRSDATRRAEQVDLAARVRSWFSKRSEYSLNHSHDGDVNAEGPDHRRRVAVCPVQATLAIH